MARADSFGESPSSPMSPPSSTTTSLLVGDALDQAFPWHEKPILSLAIGPEALCTYVGDKRWILADPRNNQLVLHYYMGPSDPRRLPFPVERGILAENFATSRLASLKGHIAGFISLARCLWNKDTFRNNPYGDLITLRGRGFVLTSEKNEPAILRLRQHPSATLAHVHSNRNAPPGPPTWVWFAHDPRTPPAHVADNLMAKAPSFDPDTCYGGYVTPYDAVDALIELT